MGVLDKLKHAWNAFVSEDNGRQNRYYPDLGYSSSFKPDRTRYSKGNEKSIITSVYNRIAVDSATIKFHHIQMDEEQRFKNIINSGLNHCLSVEANKDQQSRAFIQDIVMSMFDEGCVAVVPIDTDVDKKTGKLVIESMRVAKIMQWYPDHIEVEVYNDRKGVKQNLTFPKKSVAIIENPHYAIMNERNSVLQRLIRKLNILDAIDEQSGSGKLDLIIQLPYVIKTDARREQADKRRKDIEDQLSGSKYGIAYTDGTEKITQLNRSVENNLLKQIEYLTSMLYSQLGISKNILDGTANEIEMLNYQNQTLEPIIAAIALELDRKFISKNERDKDFQAIKYFNDPFKLVPLSKLAEMADKFTRNEILTSNEIRSIIGIRPVDDPKADELRNKNLNVKDDQNFANTEEGVTNLEGDSEENQNG